MAAVTMGTLEGAAVEVCGLTRDAALNGQLGCVVRLQPLSDGSDGALVAFPRSSGAAARLLRLANLSAPVAPREGLLVRAEGLRASAELNGAVGEVVAEVAMSDGAPGAVVQFPAPHGLQRLRVAHLTVVVELDDVDSDDGSDDGGANKDGKDAEEAARLAQARLGFAVGDPVRFRDRKEKWRTGVVAEVVGGRPKIAINADTACYFWGEVKRAERQRQGEEDDGGADGSASGGAADGSNGSVPSGQSEAGSSAGLRQRAARAPDFRVRQSADAAPPPWQTLVPQTKEQAAALQDLLQVKVDKISISKWLIDADGAPRAGPDPIREYEASRRPPSSRTSSVTPSTQSSRRSPASPGPTGSTPSPCASPASSTAQARRLPVLPTPQHGGDDDDGSGKPCLAALCIVQ